MRGTWFCFHREEVRKCIHSHLRLFLPFLCCFIWYDWFFFLLCSACLFLPFSHLTSSYMSRLISSPLSFILFPLLFSPFLVSPLLILSSIQCRSAWDQTPSDSWVRVQIHGLSLVMNSGAFGLLTLTSSPFLRTTTLQIHFVVLCILYVWTRGSPESIFTESELFGSSLSWLGLNSDPRYITTLILSQHFPNGISV